MGQTYHHLHVVMLQHLAEEAVFEIRENNHCGGVIL